MKKLFSILAVAIVTLSQSFAVLVVKCGDDGTVFEPSPLRLTSPVLSTPTLTAPVLGTPASGTLTNCTGVPVASLANLGSGIATFLATPSSANLASAVTDETGSGAVVFGTGPTIGAAIVTPKVTTIAGDGAITIASGVVLLTKGSAAAITIAAPSAQDGTRITIMAGSDWAHVVTFTGGTLLDGTTGANSTATFGAFKGSSMTVIAVGGTWLVESLNVVTCAP